jgi:hypothetical protein
MKITRQYSDATSYEIEGTEFTASNGTNEIGWMSDWTKVKDFCSRGIFTSEYVGYGMTMSRVIRLAL